MRSNSTPSTTPTSSKTSSSKDSAYAQVAATLLELGVTVACGYIASKMLTSYLMPLLQAEGDMDSAALGSAESRLLKILERQGKGHDSSSLALTNYERQIAQDVIDPKDILTQFGDIGGIDEMKQELWELAVLPLQRPDLFGTSHLLQSPKGILLYGPPGTGKTMLAKAIAHEAHATFLAVKLSKIMNKWFGESNKLIDAIFSLARKLAPSIIFVDELDTFLDPRDGSSEGGAGSAIKAEFLTLWDGITTNHEQAPVVVLGATNRPNNVDSAILRRFPRQFRISLPNEKGRLQILKLVLKGHPLAKATDKYLPTLARETRLYSGSDLKELCHCAARESIREIVKETARQAVTTKSKGAVSQQDTPNEPIKSKLRPMSVQDLKVAKTKVKRTGKDAAEYERQQFEKEHSNKKNMQNDPMMENLAALSKLLLQQPYSSVSIDDDIIEEEDDDVPQL